MMKVKLIRDKLSPPNRCLYLSDLREEPREGPYSDMVEHGLHAALLVGKLHEEVAEVADDMDDSSEYADVLQALMDLADLNGVAWVEVTNTRMEKLHERGGFSSGKVMLRE